MFAHASRRLLVLPSASALAVAATAAYQAFGPQDDDGTRQALAAPLAGGSELVMSGDCGGTNTRLQLFRVPAGTKAVPGHRPPGELCTLAPTR